MRKFIIVMMCIFCFLSTNSYAIFDYEDETLPTWSESIEVMAQIQNKVQLNLDSEAAILIDEETGTILYTKNNEFKLSDGRTIQQAIVDNTYLRKLKTTYEQLLVFQNSKKRVTEVNNSYFECKTVNFNSNEIRTKIEKIDNQIQKTDFEISKLNSIEFEI